jgi:hypothetical protein
MLIPYDPDRKKGKRANHVDWEKLPGWARFLLRSLGESPYGPLPDPGRYRWWGDVPLHEDLADQLFYLLIGSIGSGKSNLLKALLSTIVPSIKPGSDRRLWCYDPKPPGDNILPVLHAMDPQVEVVILTPSDVRSPRILFNFGGPAEIRVLWAKLAAVNKADSSGQFFERGVQRIGVAVTESLLLSGIDPTLELICAIMRERHAIVGLLGRHAHTRSKLNYVSDERLWLNLLASIEDKLDDLIVMAAYGAHATWEWSIDEFVRGESIVFLGADTRIEAALSIVRRCLFKELTEAVLALGKDPTGQRRHFVAMDEMPTFGSLDEPTAVPGMHNFVTLGRSTGAVMIGVLQHKGLLDACYGKDIADVIIDQFGNRAYLRANGGSLDEFACREIGSGRWIEWDQTESYSPKGEKSSSYSRRIVDRQILPNGTFTNMPQASPETGIHGIWTSPIPGVGTFKRIIHPSFVDSLPKAHPFIPPYLPRPVSHQFLPALNYQAIGLEPPKTGPDRAAEAKARAEGKRRAAERKRRQQLKVNWANWQPGNYPINIFHPGLPGP